MNNRILDIIQLIVNCNDEDILLECKGFAI